MLCVVQWIRRYRVGIALVTLIVPLLGLEAMGAVASPARRGATYEGSGHQPHFSKGSFFVHFRVARNGRQVTQLNVWNLAADCGRGRESDLWVWTAYAPLQAQIRRDGMFKAVWRAIGPPDIPITLTGRFLNDGSASGTLRYRGRGAFKGFSSRVGGER